MADDKLSGEELDKKAAEQNVEGRSSMSADEKRDAVGESDGPARETQDINDGKGVGNHPEAYDVEAADKISHDDNANVAGERAGAGLSEVVQGGLVDGMSRRSGREPLEGHFVTVDRTAEGVSDQLKEVGANPDRDAYGVYLSPAETDPNTGYPVTINVRLRDDTNALITVPFESAQPSEAGHR